MFKNHPLRFAKLIIAFISLYSMPLFATAENNLDAQRGIFVRAEHALKKGDMQNYQRLGEKIKTYPLYPYLKYDELKKKIYGQAPTARTLSQVEDFEKTYPDFPLLKSLRNHLLTKIAKHKNWNLFAKAYKTSDDVELQCQNLFSKYQVSNDAATLKQAQDLWLVGYSQPSACNALFSLAFKHGALTQKHIWDRFKLALDNKNFILSKHLAKQLTKDEKLYALEWEKMIKKPYLVTHEKYIHDLKVPDKIKCQMLAQGLQLFAKTEAEKALKWWKKNHHHYPFSENQSMAIQRAIGISLAHQRSDLASDWLAELPSKALDTTTIEWRIRLAIADEEWEEVLEWIEDLPPDLKDDKAWRYWKARALEKTLQHQEALAIYQQLAQSRNYYGFMASLRLKKPITLQNHQMVPDETTVKKVASLPAVQRFKELQILGKTALARIEWFRAADKMNDDELIALAKLAQKMDLPDMAIFTMAKCTYKDDVPLRFPLAHKNEIVTNAKKHNLDPAWIFAVTRQESAFFTEAVSPAGARGLMQLMPDTAKELAKKHHLHYTSENALHEPATNVQIGTVYLKNLKQNLYNNTILATASYNAGPTRTLKWLPDEPVEADIWIENIPYKETREYVKNVLAFTSIYRHRLGYPSTLALTMKPIPAKSS